MKSWYLIYSKPRQERIALDNLDRQGYESYLPLLESRRRQRGRLVDVVEPMFPRYLFVHLSDETDDWGPIRSTIGVINLVRFGMVPGKVPDDLVGALRAAEDERGLHHLGGQELRAGDRVRISSGVMAGYEAIFQARTSRERVLVLLDIAGKIARVQVPEADLERLGSSRLRAAGRR